jgi:hypothetical protein
MAVISRKIRRMLFLFPTETKSSPGSSAYLEAAFPKCAWLYWSARGMLAHWNKKGKK